MAEYNSGLATLHQPIPTRKRSFKVAVLDNLGSFSFTVPYLVAFILFAAIPVIFGLYVSLHDWNPVTGAGQFTGLSNYLQLFNSSTLAGHDFLIGLRNVVLFTVISVPFLVGIPTVVSYLIYCGPWKGLFRAIFFFPSVLSVTAITTVWSWILATQGGLLSSLFGIQLPWLTQQPFAWISIDATTEWWSMGFNIVILYAGLTQIPTSLFEASRIDGASPLRIYFSIVIPQLRNIISVVTVLGTIASFNLFAQSYLMTSGGPGSSTEPLTMFIYNQAFNEMKMGSATAMAFLMGIIIMIISFIQYRVARDRG
ncbi:carbohydrate ABC transporter permease [Alicyclobacillus ferrooxydans]|uniref:carbohydrate ABC transporter permease n=1 Tax=Alicyclobacillus ferrooxydans TaxID=471514 RepID=UPI0006D58B8B|nr:sugar ABC transporter permease [Alicyclobacillus ferrooxydans]